MDYKYIEQLLERYWECQTSLEEERILQTFFSQNEVPASLARYKALFVYEQQQAGVKLGTDFDERLLKAIGKDAVDEPVTPKIVKVEHITLAHRLRPLYRAAACVAIITLLGTAAQHSFRAPAADENSTWDYNQSAYRDSYSDPQKAREFAEKALHMFKEGPKTAVADTAVHKSAERAAEATQAK